MIQVLDGGTGAVRASAKLPERASRVTAFDGTAFVPLEATRSVVAYDLTTPR